MRIIGKSIIAVTLIPAAAVAVPASASAESIRVSVECAQGAADRCKAANTVAIAMGYNSTIATTHHNGPKNQVTVRGPASIQNIQVSSGMATKVNDGTTSQQMSELCPTQMAGIRLSGGFAQPQRVAVQQVSYSAEPACDPRFGCEAQSFAYVATGRLMSQENQRDKMRIIGEVATVAIPTLGYLGGKLLEGDRNTTINNTNTDGDVTVNNENPGNPNPPMNPDGPERPGTPGNDTPVSPPQGNVPQRPGTPVSVTSSTPSVSVSPDPIGGAPARAGTGF